MSLFYVYMYALHEVFFVRNVVRLLFLCKLRLSCVFYNKVTYLLTYIKRPRSNLCENKNARETCAGLQENW